jgi:hypothetical protein
MWPFHTVAPFRHKTQHDTFPIDRQHQPSHVMVMDTQTQNAPMSNWLDSMASQVRNAFDSFVVRAPKITLLSTKTVSNNASTSMPAAQLPPISVRGSSLATGDLFVRRPTAPYSSATALDQLTNNTKRRLLPVHPLPPIAEEEDSGKIPVRAAILALRCAVSYVNQPKTWESTQEPTGQGDPRRLLRASELLRESLLRRDQDAAIALKMAQATSSMCVTSESRPRSRRLSLVSSSKAVEQAPPWISGDHFKRKEGAAFVAWPRRRSSM